MKKTFSFFTLCLLSYTAAFSQGNITINGVISGASADNVIAVNATSTKAAPENKQDKLTLDKEGKLSITIPVTEKYNWIILVHNNKRIDFYAESGSTLTLKAEGNAFDGTAHFEGKNAAIPQYFADATKSRGGIMGYYKSLQEMSAREPVNYKAGIDSLEEKEQKFYDDAAAANKNLPKDFTKYWHTFLTYSTYDAMLQYPAMHQRALRQATDWSNIPKPLFDIPLSVPKAFDDKKIDVPFYQTYAQSYYGMMLTAKGFMNEMQQPEAPEELPSSPPQEPKAFKAFQQTDSVLKLIYKNMPPKTAELAAGRIITGESKAWTLAELEKRVADYKKQFPNSKTAADLDKAVYNIKKFDAGQPALDFTFTTLDGKTMKLSDLKGKVVYLDFWASWCGPCKGEMPYSKKIKEHFKDKTDAVFLYVSIDENEDAWKKAIDALAIKGINTRTVGWGGNIAKDYEIQSIPAYFLIDKKGNFAVKKAPRPSQTGEVINLIEGLL
jgi:thiol-disulfide isomerase/thioredoxin